MKRPLIALTALIVTSALVAQTPPAMPGNSMGPQPGLSPMFTPIAGYPYYPGPGSIPSTLCPIRRQSGVFGFTDDLSTPGNPNDDVEYFVASFSDGIALIDATPRGGSVTDATIQPGQYYDWITDSHWGYLGTPPSSVNTTGAPVGWDTGLDKALNGWDPLSTPPQPQQPIQAEAYCDSATWTYYTSNNTTNRETVVYDAGGGNFYFYSINTWRAGIWQGLITRSNGVLDLPSSGDFVFDNGGAVGKCHMIYLDQERAQLWVTDDNNEGTWGFNINPSTGILTQIMPLHQYSGVYNGSSLRPHDAMPVGDRLFISYGTPYWLDPIPSATGGVVEVLDLSVNPPVHLETVLSHFLVAGTHSVYVDSVSAPTPSIWILQESSPVNAEQFHYPSSDGVVESLLQSDGCIPFNIGSSPLAPTHHLRGLYRSGFIAQYVDGISLLDLSFPGDGQWEALGSYDTEALSLPTPGNSIQAFFDRFLGAWDVYPGADSGLVYAGGGEMGALVFRVEKGHLNRFWTATVFTSTPASPGMYPKIVSKYGPPREGRSLILEDENSGSYATSLGGVPVSYRYTLCVTQIEPSVQTIGWTPTFGGGSTPANFPVLNLDQGSFASSTNSTGLFVFPSIGLEDDRWFAQMFVQEMDDSTSPPTPTGKWAASRGTWLGVGRQ